jgi:hypothetical protein
MKPVSAARVSALLMVILVAAACTSTQTAPTTTLHQVPPSSHPTSTVPPIPAVMTSATPVGWVPVAQGDAQVSVPANWTLFYTISCFTGHSPGEVFVYPVPVLPSLFCPARLGGNPATIVNVERLPAQVAKSSQGALTINGIVVRLGGVFTPKGIGMMPIYTYFVPSLGIQIRVSGTLGSRVLHTLTRSPRDVALAAGSTPSAPSSWRTANFAGLRYSYPSGWGVSITDDAPFGCGGPGGYMFLSEGVTVSTDTVEILPGCIDIVPGLQPQTPSDGVRLDSGRYAPVPAADQLSRQCLHLHGLTACPATSQPFSILVLKVTVPGRTMPVVVSIGLAGNGMVARTILYSLRAA